MHFNCRNLNGTVPLQSLTTLFWHGNGQIPAKYRATSIRCDTTYPDNECNRSRKQSRIRFSKRNIIL